MSTLQEDVAPAERPDWFSTIGRRGRLSFLLNFLFVNLGVGIPTLASSYVRPDADITLTSENGVIGYGKIATPEEADPDVWNAGGQQVTIPAY